MIQVKYFGFKNTLCTLDAAEYLRQNYGASGMTSTTITSSTPNGVSGAATLATREKGEAVFEATVENLLAFVAEFKSVEKPERVDHRAIRPKLPPLPSTD